MPAFSFRYDLVLMGLFWYLMVAYTGTLVDSRRQIPAPFVRLNAAAESSIPVCWPGLGGGLLHGSAACSPPQGLYVPCTLDKGLWMGGWVMDAVVLVFATAMR